MLKETVSEFSDDAGTTMAAAMAYYTIFSLPPLLVLILLTAGMVFNPQEVYQALTAQTQQLVGTQAAEQIKTMIQAAQSTGSRGLMATLLSAGALVIGATGMFAQLQYALNQMWEVEPDPEQSTWATVKNVVFKRLLSFGMIVVIALLLLISLAVTAAISAIGQQLAAGLPDPFSQAFFQVINILLSLAIVTVLFAAVFKVLPDARIGWSDVWLGAGVTALLFVVGKFLIGYYLGQSDPGSTFGAAGSLVVILIWVYYTAVILFLGAEFTQVHVRSHHATIEPSSGAVKIRREKQYVRES